MSKQLLTKEFGVAIKRAGNLPRLFFVDRKKDMKEISGTGKVIYGVVFPSGKVAIEWQTQYPSVNIFANLHDFQMCHVKPEFQDNEFIWIDGYKPADEVENICNEIAAHILNYGGGRISDRTKGDLISKVVAIRNAHLKQLNGGLSPSNLRYIERRTAPTDKKDKE